MHWPPSAGLTSRQKALRLFPPKAGSRRPQVQNSPNPKSRKKIARLAHLTPHSFGGRGAQSFPSPRRWMPRIGNDMRRYTWTCLPGKPGLFFSPITTWIGRMTRSNKLPFTTPFPTQGKDHREKRVVKIVVQ